MHQNRKKITSTKFKKFWGRTRPPDPPHSPIYTQFCTHWRRGSLCFFAEGDSSSQSIPELMQFLMWHGLPFVSITIKHRWLRSGGRGGPKGLIQILLGAPKRLGPPWPYVHQMFISAKLFSILPVFIQEVLERRSTAFESEIRYTWKYTMIRQGLWQRFKHAWIHRLSLVRHLKFGIYFYFFNYKAIEGTNREWFHTQLETSST